MGNIYTYKCQYSPHTRTSHTKRREPRDRQVVLYGRRTVGKVPTPTVFEGPEVSRGVLTLLSSLGSL